MTTRYVSRPMLYCGHCGSRLETLQQLDVRRRLLTCIQEGCERQHAAFEHADEMHYAMTREPA